MSEERERFDEHQEAEFREEEAVAREAHEALSTWRQTNAPGRESEDWVFAEGYSFCAKCWRTRALIAESRREHQLGELDRLKSERDRMQDDFKKAGINVAGGLVVKLAVALDRMERPQRWIKGTDNVGDGWYWMRWSKSLPAEMVRVNGNVYEFGCEGAGKHKYRDAEFCGPLYPPEEK